MSPKFVFGAHFKKNPVGCCLFCLWIREALQGRRPFCAPFSFFVNKTELDIILPRHVMWEQAWLLTKNHAWLGIFFAAMIGGGGRNWKILESWFFFFFFLPKSEFQILFSQNHVQKVLVSHSPMVNIIAAFSISSLNSIWESYCVASTGTDLRERERGRAQENKWLQMRGGSSGDSTIWLPYLIMHAFNKHGCV